jgi:pyrimidine deaminase RibD-like protein
MTPAAHHTEGQERTDDMTKHETYTMPNPPQGCMIIEDWKLRALLRIVAETRNPSYRHAEWFTGLCADAGVDVTQAERLNPELVA